MPLNTEIVGLGTASFEHDVDARWLMAYAAALGDSSSCYFDTVSGAVPAHPVFPVCLEWPAILAARKLASRMSRAENARSVHAAHDLHILRPIVSGERLHTTLTIVGVEQKKPGAFQTYRMDTRDGGGQLVTRTYQLGIARDVALEGSPRTVEEAPAWPDASTLRRCHDAIAVPVSAGAAHTYTECARIWNPIHTDRAVALAAGLPDIILHGTATLALAVSAMLKREAIGPEQIVRLGGQFAAMVLMPSEINIVMTGRSETQIAYTAYNSAGETAIRNGFICLAS